MGQTVQFRILNSRQWLFITANDRQSLKIYFKLESLIYARDLKTDLQRIL